MIKNCTQCGCEFDGKPAVIYCSKKCRDKYHNDRLYNTIKKCEICDSEFKSRTGSKESKYCSQKCRTESRLKKIEKTCAHCGISFKCDSFKNRMYCSIKCSSERLMNRISIKCVVCSNEYETYAASKSKHCSRKCFHVANTCEFKEQQKIIDNLILSDSDWDSSTIEDIFNLSNIDIDEQLNAKSYVGSLKRRY